MNIAIMSPHCHNNGNTTVAALIAATLARQNKKVCLTHVTGKSEAIYPYYGFVSGGANATDAVQLTKLIQTGGMQKNSLSNYCKNVSDNFDVFSLDATTLISETELSDVLKYILENAPYDYVVIDVDENSLDKENVQTVIDHSDVILLVLSQILTEINRFKVMKGTFATRTKKVPKLVIVNKYRNVLGEMKDYAAKLGIKDTRHWHYLHDNPYIPYCENSGRLLFLSDQIRKKDGDVLELDTDLQKIVKDIMMTKRSTGKWYTPKTEDFDE